MNAIQSRKRAKNFDVLREPRREQVAVDAIIELVERKHMHKCSLRNQRTEN